MSSIEISPYLVPGVVERFWDKVDRQGEDECWPWIGGRAHGASIFRLGGRYGVTVDGRTVAATLDGRPRPGPEQVIDSTCGQPMCMNPKHIVWSTKFEAGQRRRERRWGEITRRVKLQRAEWDAIRKPTAYEEGIARRDYHWAKLGAPKYASTPPSPTPTPPVDTPDTPRLPIHGAPRPAPPVEPPDQVDEMLARLEARKRELGL